MEKMYLIKIGEIALKAGNRKLFEKQLQRNILKRFAPNTDYFGNNGRFYLTTYSEPDSEIRRVLSTIFGITGFCPVIRCSKNIEEIGREVLTLTDRVLSENPQFSTFKVEPRRSDKGFHLDSYELACSLGDIVLQHHPSLSVNCSEPDFTIHCEIREKAIIFSDSSPGLGGLPVGCAGRGTLLLSGGIDSPVAGYLMSKRGLKLNAVYFHTPPFTSEKAKGKVESLAEQLAPYSSGIQLFTVPFTDVQLHLKKHCKDEETTLLMRACMMRISDMIGKARGSKCLVTGEALGQVASQTVESLTYTASYPELLVLRPLIGYDKEEIINLARRIGTYDISIQPFEDCCTVFSPSRPIVKPQLDKMRAAYDKLQIEPLLLEAAENAESIYLEP